MPETLFQRIFQHVPTNYLKDGKRFFIEPLILKYVAKSDEEVLDNNIDKKFSSEFGKVLKQLKEEAVTYKTSMPVLLVSETKNRKIATATALYVNSKGEIENKP